MAMLLFQRGKSVKNHPGTFTPHIPMTDDVAYFGIISHGYMDMIRRHASFNFQCAIKNTFSMRPGA
ncbi:hypothetical protein [uncultured Mailhella sp.]|uniref:hypothetical protein n=1 Tax=uncultured Mailhella sp. TaxID=1981031 RepID=UPI0025DEBC6C|nr:hypothetical protein [uncultured Mailhella sp.]